MADEAELAPEMAIELHGDLRDLVDDVERYVDLFVDGRSLRIVAHCEGDDGLMERVVEAKRSADECLRDYCKDVVLHCISMAEEARTRMVFHLSGMPKLGRREHVFVQFALMYKDKVTSLLH